MLSREELLQNPNYVLTTYQNEIYNLVVEYKEKHHLSKGEIAKKLNVSKSYVSQILNGQFNFTLKKVVELAFAMDKVPYLEFVTKDEYWKRRDNTKDGSMQIQQMIVLHVKPYAQYSTREKSTASVTTGDNFLSYSSSQLSLS